MSIKGKFVSRAQGRVNSLRKYANHDLKSATKLLLWSLKECFRIIVFSIFDIVLSLKDKICNKGTNVTNKPINIAIKVSGGLGDILIYSTVIKELYKQLGCKCYIDITSDNDHKPNKKILLQFIFSAYKFIRILAALPITKKMIKYDAIFTINRFIQCEYCDEITLQTKAPKLLVFCKKIQKFFEQHINMYYDAFYCHTLIQYFSELMDIKRFEQPGVCGGLNINKFTKTFVHLEDNFYDKIENVKLHNTNYITLQRGIDFINHRKDSTKTWPKKHYETFIEKFRKKFPDIKIVQLGINSTPLQGVDLNLAEKTTIGEAAVILKHSLFHLDGECGLVHLKRALNGKSIVLFGPTSKKVFSYDENINIKGDGCHGWCEWITLDWAEHCLRGFKEAPCMSSISPDTVLAAAEELLNNKHEYTYRSIPNNITDNDIVKFITSKCEDKSSVIVDIFNKNNLELAKQLSNYFNDITIFRQDYEYNSFELAKQYNIKAEYGCLYNICMPDDSCDVVVWQQASDNYPGHIYYVIKELFRILKPQGYLLISGVNIENEIAEQFGLLPSKSPVQILTKSLIK